MCVQEEEEEEPREGKEGIREQQRLKNWDKSLVRERENSCGVYCLSWRAVKRRIRRRRRS